MAFSEYSNLVQQWIQQILANRGRNAELTLKYSQDIIDYGSQRDDFKLMGLGHYYSGETYYGLNDGTHFFESMGKALSYLNEAQEWELVIHCYNYLGIAALNRGNIPIALDYYLQGLHYCDTYHFPELSILFYSNLGVLYLEAGRYGDAEESLQKAYNCIRMNPDNKDYHQDMLCVCANLARSNLQLGRYDSAREMLEQIYRDHWEYAETIDKISVCCVEILYYHKVGETDKRDVSIQMLDDIIPNNLAMLDIFSDLYSCCLVLLETDQDAIFWHIVNVLEPMVCNTKITNLHLKVISLKLKFYRRNDKKTEYLKAAGLYYELSELMENETRVMVDSMVSLRTNLEIVNRARLRAEKEKEVLQQRSESDPLTKLANRFRLNEYSEQIYADAKKGEIPLTVEILDVDYFKEYNDNYGHQKGDYCLVKIAEIISALAAENKGFCARYGGDEFVIIYTGFSYEQAVSLASELQKRVLDMALEHKYSKALPVVTVSQGLCWGVAQEENRMWDFLHTADDMLYRVKKFSRNNYCVGNIQKSEDVSMGTSQK